MIQTKAPEYFTPGRKVDWVYGCGILQDGFCLYATKTVVTSDGDEVVVIAGGMPS